MNDNYKRRKTIAMTQIYNLEADKKQNQFKLQFNQLKKYYTFRKKFKDSIEKGYYNLNNKKIIGEYIQNEFCLIDSEWIENWRKHVGYNTIVDLIEKNQIKLEFSEKDYSWIKSIIEENAKENHLPLLNNENIYQENNEKINPDANFYVIDKECYESFIFKDNNLKDNNLYFDDKTAKIRHIPIKFLKKKIILMLDIYNFQITFKHKNSYIDILLKFEENNEKRKIFLDELEQKGIKKIFNENNINLDSDIEKTLHDRKLKIINKTLKLKQINDIKQNNITPNINYDGQLLNVDSKDVPLHLKNELKYKMTFINKNNFNETKILLNPIIYNYNNSNKKINLNNNTYKNNINDNFNNNNNNINNNNINNNNFINNNLNNQFNYNQNQNFNNQQFNNQINSNYPFNSNLQQLNNFNNNQNNNNINNQMNNNNQINNLFSNNSNQFINNNNNQFCNNNINQFNINNNQLCNNGKFNNNINNNLFNNNQFNNIPFNNQMNFQNLPQQMMFKQNFQTQNNLLFNNNMPNYINNNSNNNYLNNYEPLTQHKTGIQNIGQTCYMNATIQALSHISMLSYYLLKRYIQNSFDIENQTLVSAYSSLLYELYFPQEKQKYISPNIFKEIIGFLNPLFKGMHTADAKDLIFFMIEKMHQELNPIKQQTNNNIDFAQQEINSRNENLMLQLFINDFQQKNKTILSDIFYGITRSIMTCNKCKITKYSFQTFNLLVFQLKDIKDTKKKKHINLYDAFEVDKKEELLEGDNMIYCNKCGCLTNGKHQQQIYSLPKVLIIILNRGKDNKDFNEQFDFPVTLDFSDKNIIIRKDTNQLFYLCGIVTHLGESGTGGHFIAYCRNGPDAQFYCYNDAAVTPAKEEDAVKTNTSRRDSEKIIPYILLYHCYPSNN